MAELTDEQRELVDALAKSISKLCHTVIAKRLGQFFEVIGDEINREVSNARQTTLAGNSANASNVEPGNLPDSLRSAQQRSDQQPPATHAERMFRSHPEASGVAPLIQSRLFQQFLKQGFWHAHHVDLVWRYNGQDVREEADWLKDLWYVARGSQVTGNG